MSIDDERADNFLYRLSQHFTAGELTELVNLSEWDILEMFRERFLELDEHEVFKY